MTDLEKKLFGVIHSYRNVLLDMHCEFEDLKAIENGKAESGGGLIDECHKYLDNKIKEELKE